MFFFRSYSLYRTAETTCPFSKVLLRSWVELLSELWSIGCGTLAHSGNSYRPWNADLSHNFSLVIWYEQHLPCNESGISIRLLIASQSLCLAPTSVPFSTSCMTGSPHQIPKCSCVYPCISNVLNVPTPRLANQKSAFIRVSNPTSCFTQCCYYRINTDRELQSIPGLKRTLAISSHLPTKSRTSKSR